jgi:hypothetical protein
VAMDNDCRCSRVFQFIHNLYSTRHDAADGRGHQTVSG